ncbi:SDR family oxidoreductase [Nocardia lijiangensis]|uniref:SDR family oxidoreductase n=1 Tax=Nocardia lijiangensis TaxID=299618 RepID=UPI00082A951A|nr:SDR family oxidoreductase [Nocardia lijiangensis]
MDIQFDFTGKKVVIFGGTTGINFGIAEAFAAHGAAVVVVSRKRANVDAAIEKLEPHGVPVGGFVADVRDMQAVEEVFESIRAEWGAIDVLISGAAGNFLAEASALSSNGFKVVVDIDLNGTFHVLRAGLDYLAPGASVINITAPQASIPVRYQAHVCAAKAGVDQLTRVLALEWGAKGIRVNAIAPGPIAGTEGMARLTPHDDGTAIKTVPLGRLGTKDDVAGLAMFLSSSAARYISGAIIPCDGGGSGESVLQIQEAGRFLAVAAAAHQ